MEEYGMTEKVVFWGEIMVFQEPSVSFMKQAHQNKTLPGHAPTLQE